ncbi:Dabb family protein [Rhodococcus sp. OK302]|uniref:Dabb family protein n=1 Tax=Rhodococcus sp. OK302 TaxID=1882769 RepID=UPI000B94127D|nr:Dabb family protein [Rhodococcus sp. OK302]OYD67980.1 stress responsive alpha/beta barrel protein [Rhodococcus sp. OK302]
MYSVTRIVQAADGCAPDEWAAAVIAVTSAAESCGAARHIVSETLPGVINGGDLIIHAEFTDKSSWQSAGTAFDGSLDHPAVEGFHGVEYQNGTSGRSTTDTRTGIYRALFVRVAPDTPPTAIEHFERDLLRMPALVSSIGAWRLSRVSASIGPTQWTHVWEQEFTDHESLSGQYLDHPIHWGVVDRWFDPECTEVIIRDRVCHTFCALDTPILLGS